MPTSEVGEHGAGERLVDNRDDESSDPQDITGLRKQEILLINAAGGGTDCHSNLSLQQGM